MKSRAFEVRACARVDFGIPDAGAEHGGVDVLAIVTSSFAISRRAMPEPERDSPSPSPAPDASGASAREASRFEEIFTAHYDFVWRSLRRLGVPEANVDDAAQEAFVVVARRLGEIEPGLEKSFLFGVTRRVAAAARRTAHARAEHVSESKLDEQAAAEPTPEEALGTQRARAMLTDVLDAMDDDVREAFILFELEGLTKGEVATMLGIPEGTAASRLRRGREEFLASARRLKAKLHPHDLGGGE